jgi:hypothetical protein
LRVSSFINYIYGLSSRVSSEAAQRLIARLLFPRLPRALFGLEDLIEEFDEHTLSPKIDVKAVRKVVTEVLASLPMVSHSGSSA